MIRPGSLKITDIVILVDGENMSQYQNQMGSTSQGSTHRFGSEPQLGHYSPNFHNLPSFSGISLLRHLMVIIQNVYRSTRRCSTRISRWDTNGTATNDGMASKWSIMFLSDGDSCDSYKLSSKTLPRNRSLIFIIRDPRTRIKKWADGNKKWNG